MNAIRELVASGGPVIIALMVISVFLYERCFNLLIFLIRARQQLRTLATEAAVDLSTTHEELRDAFRQQRLAIDAMITAAPLLGLLGTVLGMIGAFNHLASHGNERSMEGLAHGISEVLVATESGLAVAIPAVLIVYYAHRQLEKAIARATDLELAAEPA